MSHADDLLRRLRRDLLDVHAAFGRRHDRNPCRATVHQNRNVQLAPDVAALLDVHPLHPPPVRPGLVRHQGAPQHLRRGLFNLPRRARQTHPAAGARLGLLETPLAAPARVNLRLHNPNRAAKTLRDREPVILRMRNASVQYVDTVALQ